MLIDTLGSPRQHELRTDYLQAKKLLPTTDQSTVTTNCCVQKEADWFDLVVKNTSRTYNHTMALFDALGICAYQCSGDDAHRAAMTANVPTTDQMR